jgi:predicted phosphoadenosine phosphosulfate sulfurtransferase
MRAVVKRREDNYVIKGDDKQYDKVYPIYDWRHEDIWTAIKVFGWDYCEAYDIMEMAGVSLNDSRIAPPYGEQPLLGLWQYKVAFPDIWHRMVDRVPGVNTAGMYARTELYNIGHRAQKPPDLSWQEFIKGNVERFPLNVQPQVVQNLKEWMYNHYKQTRDPILPFSPHPYTAMNWEFLMGMSMKGDFKNRMSPKYEKDPENVRQRILGYVTEFYTMKWQGRLWEIELDDDAELELPDWVHEALGQLIRGEVTL